MPYELRMDGQSIRSFPTEEEALAYAREAMRTHPESEPEIWDTTTGEPIGQAASKEGRDDLARKIGF